MKLTKENIYINLQGKSKEERLEIANYLLSINEKCEEYIKDFIQSQETLEYYGNMWFTDISAGNKQEITIEQLKEILQPMDLTLEQRLQKAEVEVKRLQEAIENIKIKAGDWVIVNEAELIFKASDYDVKNIDSKRLYRNVKKIQDSGLISKLNELIKQ